MAKKSFMNADNPAMQFISAPVQEKAPVPETRLPEMSETKAPVADVPAPVPVSEPAPAKVTNSMENAFDIAPKSAEHKSKRAQLLMTPSLHQKVCKKAASLNMSFNELVNLVLEKYVQ